MKFTINVKLCTFGAKNSGTEYKMEEEKLDEITEDLEVIISGSLKVGKQCAKAASKGYQILEFIVRTFISKKKISYLIYTSYWFTHIFNTVFRHEDRTWSRT